MKGVLSVSLSPPKRRWRPPAVAAVLVLSLLTPVVFLLGFHKRSSPGYSVDDRSDKSSSRNYGNLNGVLELAEDTADIYKGGNRSHTNHDNEITRKSGQFTLKEQNKTVHSSLTNLAPQSKIKNHDINHNQAAVNSQPKDIPTVQQSPSKQLPASSIKNLGNTLPVMKVANLVKFDWESIAYGLPRIGK